MKGQWSKPLVVTIVFLLLAGACAAPPPPPTPTPIPPSPTPDPAAPVKAWAEALNQGEVDAAIAPFADDVQYHFVFDATSKEQLRGVADWLTAISHKYEVNDCQQLQSDRVVCTIIGSDACLTAFGAPNGLASTGTYIFQKDGKIGQVSATTEGADWDSYWKWLDAVITWASTNRPDELAKYAAQPMTREVAPVLLKLCQEYGESLKVTPVAAAATPEPVNEAEKLARSFVDAYNKRDIEATLALFVDSGLTLMVGGEKATTKQGVQDKLNEQIGYGRVFEITDCTEKPKGVGCTMLERGDPCAQAWAGEDVWRMDVTLVPRAGKIQLLNLSVAVDQANKSQVYSVPFVDWATANRAADWKKFYQPTAYDLKGRPFGELGAQICREYLEATKK